MRYIRNHVVLLSQLLVWLSLAAMAFGQAAPPKPLTEAEFTAMLQARLKQVDETSDLIDTEKAKVKDLYKQALTEMEAVRRWIETTAQNEKLALDAPKETDQIKASLAAPPQGITAIPIDHTLLQIEQGISQREAALDKLRKALADDEEELKGRAGRRAKLPEQINEAKKSLADINAQLDLPPPKDEKPAVGMARRLLLVTQRRKAEQEIICRQKELEAYEKRTELLPLRRELEASQIALANEELKQWREAANRRRQQEAEQQVQQASREADQAHSTGIVRRLAEDNARLAEKRKPLVEAIAEVLRQKEQVDKQLVEVTKVYKEMKDREEVAGKAKITSHVGSFLRTQRETLPNLREYLRAVELQQQKQSDYGLARLELLNKAFALTDQRIQESLQNASPAEQDGNRAELEAAVREALKTQADYLKSLTDDYENYLGKLADLITAEAELIAVTKDCQQFIDERVLWIQSAGPLGLADVRPGNDALWWLIGPKAWLDIGRTLFDDAGQNPATSVVAILGFLVLFAWRLRVTAVIQEIGEKAARGNCYRFVPTLEATVLTVVAAGAWPAVVLYVGWRLTVAAGSPDVCQWLGHGLSETARVFLALELLRRICCPQGLGESHFGWSTSALKVLRANLRWFSPPALLLMCAVVTFAWKEDPQWDASLGRACFIVAFLCFSLALHRVLRPGSPVFQAMIVARRGGWLERFRYVWYPLCVLTPAALAILAAVGYHYTARQLAVRLILTSYVLVGGIVCRAVLLRWTLVNQRKLAIQQAKQRRAAALSELNAGEEAAGGDELPSAAVPERDIAAINSQTRRLIEFSLGVAAVLVIWCAWCDVLPALNTVNTGLWTTTQTVPVTSSLPDGRTKLDFPEVARVVKVADLFVALIVLVTTFIAAKNIPGLLEMAVLQHLPLDAGARYAVATVCRYLITIFGLVFCCGVIGLGWSKVQWLVAAMGLGLGFGLQEIFANFISGLIILFERPVRVGDVVTIDGITGVVSKIRIRATTVTDGDRKELIIPNKEFITGRVLNWTLSDPVNRVTINVGVAYGSDTKLAERLLLQVAKNHPLVLADPPPGVSLESFGDSSLKFVLRCFLPNLENRGTVIHELHMAVDREFRAAGIEMPFPQHDVHVRSIDVPTAALPPGFTVPDMSWPSAAQPEPAGKSAGRAA
jgi:potassium-dependent mechanosensitive channel